MRLRALEAASEQVEEEAFVEVAIGGGGEGIAYGPYQGGALVGVLSE